MIYAAEGLAALTLCLLLCWLAIPERAAARYAIQGVAVVAGVFWWLVYYGDTGTLTKYRWEWQAQTSGFAAAVVACWVTAGYVYRHYTHQRAMWPAAIGLYFLGDVVVNVLYRTTEWVYDYRELLVQFAHCWHGAVFLAAGIWGVVRERAACMSKIGYTQGYGDLLEAAKKVVSEFHSSDVLMTPEQIMAWAQLEAAIAKAGRR